MKNKPDPALLPTSYLSNEIKDRMTKSHEIIALSSSLMGRFIENLNISWDGFFVIHTYCYTFPLLAKNYR
jgi:hypothetical protein